MRFHPVLFNVVFRGVRNRFAEQYRPRKQFSACWYLGTQRTKTSWPDRCKYMQRKECEGRTKLAQGCILIYLYCSGTSVGKTWSALLADRFCVYFLASSLYLCDCLLCVFICSFQVVVCVFFLFLFIRLSSAGSDLWGQRERSL